MATGGERLRVSLSRQPAMQMTRVGLAHESLVYVLVTGRPVRYPSGRSRIVTIGMSRKGLAPVATTLARRAEQILVRRGISECEVRVVTCRGRRRARTWEKLERAMLLVFRETFGDIPVGNTRGANIREQDEFQYFSRTAVKHVIEELSA